MHEYPTEPEKAVPAAPNEVPTWRNYANVAIITAAFALLPIMSHAGGLGIAPLAFFVGVVGYLTTRPSAILAIPPWFWALGLFLIWANITALWTPYEDTQTLKNPIKLGLGVVIFLGAFLSFRSAALSGRILLRHLLTAMMLLSLGLLFIDLLSGYALTHLVDPLNPGEDVVYKNFGTEMNLGHAVTVLALFVPLVMMMMRREFVFGWLFAVIFAFLTIIVAVFAGLFVGVLSITASLAAMLAARIRPEWTLRMIIWMGIFSVLFAPLIGLLAGQASPEFKAAIPFSWEHRLEMWDYTTQRIFEAPLLGHGFDAARTFDATFSTRGIEAWSIVSLHPHNAGLHIWVETGFIGAATAVFALLTMGIAAEHFSETSKLRSMALAGLISAMIIICNFTYGVWQDWWWATLILASAAMYLLPKSDENVP